MKNVNKTILIIAISLTLFTISGCYQNEDNKVDYFEEYQNKEETEQERLIKNALDLGEDKRVVYEKMSETTYINITTPFILTKKSEIILRADKYCRENKDCEGMGFVGSCFNINMDGNDMYVSDLFQTYSLAGLKTHSDCICHQSQCTYSGEPFIWMSENIDKKDKIMMWWDYGKNLKAVGLNPIITRPSKSISWSTTSCTEEESLRCIYSTQELSDDSIIKDVSSFFSSSDLTESLCIALKHNISYIYIDRTMMSKFAVIYDTYKELEGKNDTWRDNKNVFDESGRPKKPLHNYMPYPLLPKLYYNLGMEIPWIEHIKSFTIDGNIEHSIYRINYPEDIDEDC